MDNRGCLLLSTVVNLIGLYISLQIDGLEARSYQWRCSELDEANNQYYLPDIPIANDTVVADTRRNLRESTGSFTYIFPIPMLNCSGTVSAIRYCYSNRTSDINFDTERSVFTLFLLEQQNRTSFRVSDVLDVRSTPTTQICTNIMVTNTYTSRTNNTSYCCDTNTVSFPLPGSNFAYGIAGTSILRYEGCADYDSVEHYRYRTVSGPILEVGIIYTFSDRNTDRDVRLLQFIIDQESPTIATVATTATTAAAAATVATTATPATASTPTTTTTETVNNNNITSANGEQNVTAAGDDTFVTTSFAPAESSTIAIIGGVLGLVVAVLIVVIVIVVIVVLKRRKTWKPDESAAGGAISYSNAVYGGILRERQYSNEYAEAGPNAENAVPYAEAISHTYTEVREAEVAVLPSEYEAPSEYEVPLNQTSKPFSHVNTGVQAKKKGTVYAPLLPPAKKYTGKTKEPAYEYEDEDIYMEPARDERGLYAQLEKILIDKFTRKTVTLGDELGSGQFGTVYKGLWQSASRGKVKVAVKTLKEGSREEDRVKFLQEAAIMGQFKHPNVLEAYGVVTIGEPILLVLEFLEKGDLRDHLLHKKSDGVSVNDHTLLDYCRQVASGMTYLSYKAYVHRDLAARNILVSDDETCKIADFGMSRDLMDENYYVSHGGMIPVKWTAPEALHYKKYSTASDVWSYGALMYEIWSVGHKPFENLSNNKVLKLVDSGYRLPPPPGCPRALYAIMMSCWHPETSKRPDFAAISQQLFRPTDTKLLKWAEEDKSTHPEVDKLGADLLYAEDLYRDLQVIYKQDT